MGICSSSSSAEQAKSRQIDALVEKDNERERQKIKMLLLGACGRPTGQRRGIGAACGWR
jgi:hypothetical protein